MLSIENEQIKQVRNPGRPDSEAGTVRPMRTPSALFHGWGPKLFVAALAICGLSLSTKPAFAATQIAIISGCAAPDHGASLLSAPDVETPDGVGAAGEAIMRADLSSAGRVRDVAMAQSSGTFELDFAAMQVVRESRFAPASIGCTPAGESVLYDVIYTQ